MEVLTRPIAGATPAPALPGGPLAALAGGAAPAAARTTSASQFRRQGRLLWQQQFWLWGQDIKRAEGNLLLDRGFTRQRPPDGVTGSSAYALDLGDGRALALWGFGLLVSDPACGGLYVARADLKPRLLASVAGLTNVWRPDQVPPHQRPGSPEAQAVSWRLLAAGLAWVGRYEAWVRDTQGEAYRAGCLCRWPKAVGRSADLATRWAELAAQAAVISRQRGGEDQSDVAPGMRR